MQKENICKFIRNGASDRLYVKNFIYEREKQTLMKKTRLKENRVYLFVSGDGSIYFDDSRQLFEKGNLIFAFEGETVYIYVKSGCECMYISFEGMRAQELFYRFSINIKNRVFDASALIPLWRESLSAASEKTIDLVTESMLLYSFSRLDLYENKQNNVVMDIIKISEKNFSDSTLSLEKIANELGYNPKYVSHIFKEKMKIGYCEYLRSLRIKNAISLFDSGLDSIKNVAFLSGFSDPLYFSTVFKKSVGKSPTDYIKK